MLRDVTFGQYYLANSFVHKMDARVKMLLCILYMVGIFFVTSFAGFLWITLFLALAIGISKVPLRFIVKPLKGIVILLILTGILNIFFTKRGTLLFSWWKIEIYDEGIIFAAKMVIRITYLIMGTSLLTLTTTPVDLTYAFESLLKPLRLVKVPVDAIALVMSMALTFIPTLIEETDRIIRAQKARGADFDTGNLVQRAKAFVPILIPLLVGSLRRAEELANAMNSRCYEDAKKRTRMRVVKLSWRDFVGVFVMVVFFGAIFTLYAMNGKWGTLPDAWQKVMYWLYY